MNTLTIIVGNGPMTFTATYNIQKDEVTLPAILESMVHALQIAGYTYVNEIATIEGCEVVHSSRDAK